MKDWITDKLIGLLIRYHILQPVCVRADCGRRSGRR